ncbi:GHMP kinase family protein, partial [Striga hermonthica]
DVARGLSIQEVIGDVLKANLDHKRTNFQLPPMMMSLVLGEPGTGGSSTPSMVGAVKKWQKSDPQGSFKTWTKLSEANSALEMHLNNLSEFSETNSDAYRITIDKCSKLTSEKWAEGAVGPYQIEVIKALLGARDSMLSIQTTMHKIGEAAGIPVDLTRCLPLPWELQAAMS